MKLKINKKKLNEDTLSDVVDDFGKAGAEETKKALDKVKSLHFEIESEPWADMNNADLEKTLNNSLRKARQFQNWISIYEEKGKPIPKNFQNKFGTNVLLVGPAGVGKTARVKNWADNNNINLVLKSAQTMDASDLGGIISRMVGPEGTATNRATKLSNDEFSVLDTPDTVLFLDELNRAEADIRGALLTLIQDHVTIDHESNSGMRLLKGMLFTVAAVNPNRGEAYETNKLDMAMRTRFRTKEIQFDNLEHLEYLRDKAYGPIIKDEDLPAEDRIEYYGKYNIAKKLLTDSSFQFDTPEEEEELNELDYPTLNYRSLDNLLDACDGTKDDFLDLWPEFCNPNKYEVVEAILSDYIDFDPQTLEDDDIEDIDDEANSVFKDNEQSESSWDKIADLVV